MITFGLSYLFVIYQLGCRHLLKVEMSFDQVTQFINYVVKFADQPVIDVFDSFALVRLDFCVDASAPWLDRSLSQCCLLL